MLRQIEGSRAVAETVALLPAGGDRAYPISPQTHIVEGALATWCRPASSRRAST